MSESPALAPKGPIRPALITAGVVAVALLLIQIVQFLFGTLPWQLAYGNASDLGFVPGSLGGILLFVLPFSVGVWLSLWLILPVEPGQRLVTVIIRASVASAAGSVLVYLLGILIRLLQAGYGDFFRELVAGLFGIVSTAVANLPLVALVLVIQHLVLTRGQRV